MRFPRRCLNANSALLPVAFIAADQIPLNLQAPDCVLALLISSPVCPKISRMGGAGYLASVSAKSHACAVVANLRKQHHYGVMITYGNADPR